MHRHTVIGRIIIEKRKGSQFLIRFGRHFRKLLGLRLQGRILLVLTILCHMCRFIIVVYIPFAGRMIACVAIDACVAIVDDDLKCC